MTTDDILARYPMFDLYETLTGKSARVELVKGLLREVKTRNGRRFLQCPNPLHGDDHPSCRVKEDGYFRCMSCGVEGNKLGLIKLVYNLGEEAPNAQAIGILRKIAKGEQISAADLQPQPAPDSRFVDGKARRLENERLTNVFKYVDAQRRLRYEVLRYEGTLEGQRAKRFAQRRALPKGVWTPEGDWFVYRDGAGNTVPTLHDEIVRVSRTYRNVEGVTCDRAMPSKPWHYSLDGVERVPYRCPEVINDSRAGKIIIIPEGEPKTDLLKEVGFGSTTNSEGTSFAYPESWKQYLVGAAAVFTLGDCDDVGRYAARMRARALDGAAPIVAALDPWPERNDKYDIRNYDNRRLPRQERKQRIREVLNRAIELAGIDAIRL